MNESDMTTTINSISGVSTIIPTDSGINATFSASPSENYYDYFTTPRSSDIENSVKCFQNYKAFCPQYIKDVYFYPKAVKMEFTDGITTVAKLQEGDEYNKETGMMVCIMEYIYGGKQYNNTFRHWIKHDEDRKAEKIAAEKRAEEEKKVKERQAAKKARRKAARKAQAKQEAIDIQKEAYKQAMAEQREEPDYWWLGSDEDDFVEEYCVASSSIDEED